MEVIFFLSLPIILASLLRLAWMLSEPY